MSRDRLAEMRRAANSPNGSDNSMELQQTNVPGVTNLAYGADDMTAFYAEITSISEDIENFSQQVRQIRDLHSRSLNGVDERTARLNEGELDRVASDARASSNALKRRIQALEKDKSNGRDGQIKHQQISRVKSKFVQEIQNYHQTEKQFRDRYKQRLERQFRIVRPDATPEEVNSVVNDDSGNNQIFRQALMNSNRVGESTSAYREVQDRHADIQRIEKTITELAQLFNDMSQAIEQQDEQIDVIKEQAEKIDADLEKGNKKVQDAVKIAIGTRKKRWIAFFIFLIIIAIIVIAVAVSVAGKK